MLRKAPRRQKTCYLLQTNLKVPYFMCDWENNFNHFINLQEILEVFYTDDQKQSAYMGRGGTNNDNCHPLQADLWEYLLNNHLFTNENSLGTEGLDSESEQVPTTKMVVLELIQSQVQISKLMQWKVVLQVKRGMNL
jgi:hypothetical protein